MKKGTKWKFFTTVDENNPTNNFFSCPTIMRDNGDDSITFVTFKEFLNRDAINVNPDFFFSNEVAEAKLSNINLLTYGDRFNNTQLGIEYLSYYQVTSIYRYSHSERENWGSAEKDGDNFVIVSASPAGKIYPAFNKNTFTFNEKSSARRDFNKINRFPLMVMYVPHSDATFNECSKLFFSYSSNKIWNANFDCEELLTSPNPEIWNMHKPVIRVTGPTTCNSNDKIQLHVNILDPETNAVLEDDIERTVYIQPISGYTNKSRCKIINGIEDSFTFRALDLNPGEKVRIKFGWRNITGLLDYNITIT